MPTMNVYLVDLDPAANNLSGSSAEILRLVSGLFSNVVRAAPRAAPPGRGRGAGPPRGRVDGVNVQLVQAVPDVVAPIDLLIYLVPVSTRSVIGPGMHAPSIYGGSHLGLTYVTGSGAASSAGSEVYVATRLAGSGSGLRGMVGRAMTPGLIANLIFHEAMHNKLGRGDDLHTYFRQHTRIAAASITDGTQPSPEELRAMATALPTERMQWRDGATAYRDVVANEEAAIRGL